MIQKFWERNEWNIVIERCGVKDCDTIANVLWRRLSVTEMDWSSVNINLLSELKEKKVLQRRSKEISSKEIVIMCESECSSHCERWLTLSLNGRWLVVYLGKECDLWCSQLTRQHIVLNDNSCQRKILLEGRENWKYDIVGNVWNWSG